MTPESFNVHVAGQEDSPFLGGEVWSPLAPTRCWWRVRKAKPVGSARGRDANPPLPSLLKPLGSRACLLTVACVRACVLACSARVARQMPVEEIELHLLKEKKGMWPRGLVKKHYE